MTKKKKVTRLTPTKDTLNLLFSVCGNVCAFPDCKHEVFDDKNLFIAQVCHIEAASAGGQRFNPNSNNEDRRQFSNLMILCYRHHKETDNIAIYPTEKMHELKATHEAKYRPNPKFLSPHIIDLVYAEEQLRYLEMIAADTKQIISTQNHHTNLLNRLLEGQNPSGDTPTSLSPGEYEKKITGIMAMRRKNQHIAAIGLLEDVHREDWSKLNEREKYLVLGNIGVLHLDLLENELAADYFIKALGHQPDNPKAINFGVLGHVLKGNKTEAERWIKKGLELSPSDPGIYSSMVRMNSKLPLDGLLAIIPESIRQQTEVAYEIARSCQEHQDYPQAILWAQIALNAAPESRYELRALLATIILHSIQRPFQVVTGQVSQDIKVKAAYVIELYTLAWEEIKGTELQKSRTWYLVNRGVGRKYLGDIEGAYDDFYLACSLDTHLLSLKHLLIGAIQLGRMDKAWEVMRQLKSNVPDADEIELAILEADLKWQTGEKQMAIELIEQAWKELPSAVTDRHINEFLIDRYTNLGELEKAAALNAAYAGFAENPLTPVLNAAKIALAAGDNIAAGNALDNALRLVGEDTSEIDIYDLAKQFEHLGRLDKAIELFERVTNIEVYSQYTRNLLDLYYKAGEFGKLLKLSDGLINLFGPVAKLTEIKSFVYENINDLEKAIQTCRTHLEVYPDDEFIRARLALIYSRAGCKEELKAVMAAIHHLDRTLPASIQFQLAALYREIGNMERFREFSYEARRQFYDEVKAHEAYMSLHMIISNDTERQADPQQVAVGSAVTLKTTENPVTFIIDDREDLLASKGELSPQSSRALALLGKKVGDLADLSGQDYGTGNEILTIQTKHNFALRESLNMISTVFAGSSGFKAYTHGNTGEVREDLKVLFDHVDARVEQETTVDKHLAAYELPVSAIAVIKKMNLIKVWSQLVSGGEAGIKNANSVHEVLLAHNALKDGIPVLLDVTALCTLAHISAFEDFALLENRKMVSQSSLQEFRELIQELEQSAVTGSLNIGKSKAGRYLKGIQSPEDIRNQIAHYQNIINWSERNCEILPCQAALQMNAHRKAELDKAVGESTIDSILTAQEQNCLLYSEDAILREVAAVENKVNGIAGFIFVLFLKVNRKISAQRYIIIMTDLFALHYKGMPTEVGILMEATRRAKYKPGWPLNYALEGLVSPLADDVYTLRLVCKYLVAIYKERIQVIFDQDIVVLREQLVISVLKVLEGNFDLKRSQQDILSGLIEQSSLHDENAAVIGQILRRYVAAQK
jgi:tetratricopeptide (TPR) repeat protein